MRQGTPQAKTADAASRWLCLCGVVIPWVMAAFVVAASLVNPGYNHVTETVSLLGTREREHPEVIRIGFVVLGILTHCLAWGIYRVLGRTPRAKAVWLLFAVCGTCVVFSGLFRDDLETLGVSGTLEGTLHSVFAFGALWGLVLTILVVAKAVHGDPAWGGFAWLSIAAVALALVLSLGFLSETFHQFEGLLQRFLYAVLLVWVETVSLRSYHLATGQGTGGLPAVEAGETGRTKVLSA